MTAEAIMITIENHGVTLVITVFVLFYMFKITNLYYTKLEKKIIKDHSKELKNKWSDTIKNSTIIHQLLYKALYLHKGDRVYVFEYHNGGHSISGIDFLKVSNTFEVINENVSQNQKHSQNLPIGMFAYINMRILENKTMCIVDIEDIKNKDIGSYEMLKQQGILSIYIIGLYDAQGHPIGFFGLDFTKRKMLELNEKLRKDLEILSYKIAGLLY